MGSLKATMTGLAVAPDTEKYHTHIVSSHPIHSTAYHILLFAKVDLILYLYCLGKVVFSVVHPSIMPFNSVLTMYGKIFFLSWNKDLFDLT